MLRKFLFPTSYLLLFPIFLGIVNWQFLLLYLVPAALPFVVPVLPFLVPPIVFSLCITGLWYNKRTKQSSPNARWRVVEVNVVFLVALLICAELYKNALIFHDAAEVPHDCLHIHTFLKSLHTYGDISKTSHAVMMIGDTPYYWSYKKRKFFPGAPNPWLRCPMGTFDITLG